VYIGGMDLLTWNLGKNRRNADLSFKALELVYDHLKWLKRRGIPFVAALQECPDDTDGLQRALPGSYVHGNVDRAIISSTPLVDLRDMDRFVAARTRVEGNDLAVISYHGVDRLRRGEPTQRGGRSSEFRWQMDDYCGMDPAIVMGDFNAQPKDPEIQSRWCFSFALDGDFNQ
jgi:endonuclease/exonuclease/phosphatase family metal-dependent hydrolase